MYSDIMWESKLTGELVTDEELDASLEEHLRLFENECDEYDIMENFILWENGKATNISLFEYMYS